MLVNTICVYNNRYFDSLLLKFCIRRFLSVLLDSFSCPTFCVGSISDDSFVAISKVSCLISGLRISPNFVANSRTSGFATRLKGLARLNLFVLSSPEEGEFADQAANCEDLS